MVDVCRYIRLRDIVDTGSRLFGCKTLCILRLAYQYPEHVDISSFQNRVVTPGKGSLEDAPRFALELGPNRVGCEVSVPTEDI